ncbi:hypothetical protein BaRGS_00020329 [Batillaria attramentaria]|uniref:Uncharacterized protein n=1 Tax=Batillaria attramentaria TaxID=370345 RepID=A0ABD0KMA0_9CAEN
MNASLTRAVFFPGENGTSGTLGDTSTTNEDTGTQISVKEVTSPMIGLYGGGRVLPEHITSKTRPLSA